MDFLWNLISGSLGGVWGYVAAAGAALLGVFGIYLKGRSDAKTKLAAKQAAEHQKRTDAGRVAASKAQADLAKGKTPEQIRRENDGAWE